MDVIDIPLDFSELNEMESKEMEIQNNIEQLN